jgi:type I site-specific restriction-modification system R (restriction) subunit
MFPDEALAFIHATQGKVWEKLEALHAEQAGARVLESLRKWLDTHGMLATLRHGFKCFGKTLRIAFFRPAHDLNPELQARYQANRLGLARQLHFSPRNEKSLDVVLSVNGIPVVTLELKNPLSAQTTANAIHQYRHDRDPREPIFAFAKRTQVHFAVDTEEEHMTTRLFDSVLVITDRMVVDRQLQNTIYQFDHRQGVVQKIDEDSHQLAEALEAGVPIIITTLQKFPFVSGQLMKLAEERGEGAKSHLPMRKYAVIIDEAHSSQSGETATELKGVLGGAELRRKAQEMAE